MGAPHVRQSGAFFLATPAHFVSLIVAVPAGTAAAGWSTGDVAGATLATYLRQMVAIMREDPDLRAASVDTINRADYPSYGLVTMAGVETVSWQANAAAVR